LQTASTTPTAEFSAAALAAEVSSGVCVHCGRPCGSLAVRQNGQAFCCHGCLTVFELLQENGLGDFYRFAEKPGVRVQQAAAADRFGFLDESAVRERMLDFSDGQMARVTFHTPAIHCVACVWLLENLFKLHPGIGRSVVDFEQKRVTLSFELEKVSLSELAALLSSIGYEPVLKLDSLEHSAEDRSAKSLYLRLGVAGFAFGNIMLFSICLYSGMDRFSAPAFKPLFGWVSLLLTLPVLLYSASGYWGAAWLGLRQRTLTIDLPIALGLVALFAQSLFEIATGTGVGYLDSLTGLVFFLLIGRVFQDRTYKRLSFDRDYKSFFPLAVKRLEPGGEHTVPLSELAVGDRLRLRQGELIPADSRVIEGTALIDYSFVTGESDPVERGEADVIYAGGQQVGGAMEIEVIKPVSQSYLTSLWGHEAFAKSREKSLDTLLNRFSRGFTLVVIALAFAAGAWWWSVDVSRAIRAFTSVLIVACPCALALSAPFALGTAQRLLGRFRVFGRNAHVVEALAAVDAVVFDKTGTLTGGAGGGVRFLGEELSSEERRLIKSAAARSTHPHSKQIVASLRDVETVNVDGFEEVAGRGICAQIGGTRVRLGSPGFLRDAGLPVEASDAITGSTVLCAIGLRLRGTFEVRGALRPNVVELLSDLSESHELVLLSGDNDRERQKFQSLLGNRASLRFHQSPADKLAAIEGLRSSGRSVMMVGDGLNDAGALRQSDVGVAVVEEVGTFSPASDVIMEARHVGALASVLRFSRGCVSVVWASILLSLLYNLVGLGFAASGRLSPVICAILMPISSITVVTFACVAVGWTARRTRLSHALNPERNPCLPST